VDAATFHRFCGIAYEQAGITLGDSKEALVEARVGKRMRALGLATERDYLAYLENRANAEEIVNFLDVISTNHTSFFREPDHFELLRKTLGDWRQQGYRRLRMWSAASSTGEEPYTIAFTTTEVLDGSNIEWLLLATDISTKVLARAEAGVYAASKVELLSRAQQKCFFERTANTDELRVRQEIRNKVVFRRLNLATPPYPMRGPFDVIFCRNVMIYFDQIVRQRIISAMEELLAPNGLLIIGHAEALSGVRTSLRMLKPSVFLHSEEGPGVAL
jgi:chemotaxis protein methyltransferase CheR